MLPICFKSGERSTCFCFICKVVPNAYSPVCKAFFVPKMFLTGEYQGLFLSYVAPYFVYQIAYETILSDIQALHYEEPYGRSLRFLYESVALY